WLRTIGAQRNGVSVEVFSTAIIERWLLNPRPAVEVTELRTGSAFSQQSSQCPRSPMPRLFVLRIRAWLLSLDGTRCTVFFERPSEGVRFVAERKDRSGLLIAKVDRHRQIKRRWLLLVISGTKEARAAD